MKSSVLCCTRVILFIMMPKAKPSKSCHLKQIVAEFGDYIFSTDGDILYCKMCDTKVAAEKRFTVQQHIGRDKHIRAVQISNKKKSAQRLLQQCSYEGENKSSDFFRDLCDALVSAYIPFWALINEKLKNFLEVNCGRSIPDESTLRKNYLSKCYNNILEMIRNKVHGKKIFVSFDETCDMEARYVANVIIGTLEIDGPGEVFLLTSDVLESVNHSTICKLFDGSMFLLWPEGIRHDEVLLFVIDAAPYILRAGKSIKMFYTKKVHDTCLAHALHRVTEEVRSKFPQVDPLV